MYSLHLHDCSQPPLTPIPGWTPHLLPALMGICILVEQTYIHINKNDIEKELQENKVLLFKKEVRKVKDRQNDKLA